MATGTFFLMLGKVLYQYDAALLKMSGLTLASIGFFIGGFFVGCAFLLGLSAA
jgi:hypothetical protein